MAWRLSFPVDVAVEVVPTHVERETGNFFVHISNDDSSKLDDLMGDISTYVTASNSRSKGKTFKVGDICLAKYVDEMWYRGKVLGVDGNGCKVFFVDYGNTDFVATNNILPSHDKFLTLPPQAYECELANVKPVGGSWSTELFGKLEELIIEQTFVAQAVSLKSNNVIVLSLFKDSLMTKLAVKPLISAGYLERTDVENAYSQRSRPSRTYKYLELDNFSFEDVHISYCENLSKFCCLLLKNSTALQKLMYELDQTYQDASEDDYQLKSCCQDNPCCAKYSEDDMWYRAVITSESPLPSGEINVKFVDYGNSENVHISNLLELDDRFLDLPMQALECTLYGVRPKGGKNEWPQDAVELFESMTNEKHLVTYLNKVANNSAEVFLFDTSEETKDVNFAQVLVDNGKAIAVRSLTDYKKTHNTKRRKSSFGIINLLPNSSEPVVVTNAESPSDFYCQLLKHSSDLDKLMDDISQYYGSIGDVDDTITLPQTGMLCCGRYTEDDGWYRALILASHIAEREVEVLYVDYGNIEVLPITRIKELKPQFAALPQQAVPCCLYGVSPSAPNWTDQEVEEFQNAIVGKELVIKVVSLLESQRYAVSLVETVGEEEYSISEQLVQKGFAISDGSHPGVSVETNCSDYQAPPVEIDNYIDVEVTHVENLDQFWCHLMNSAEDMETLMSNIQDYYDTNPPKAADPNLFIKGGACCAKFSEDDMWYRAKILEKMSNNRFLVRFVDYGNCEILASKSVAVLNREFLQLPVQAIECSLVNLSPSDKKNKKLVHKFLDLVNGKELVCRLDERDSEGKYMVLVIDTGHGGTVNINEEMAEHIAKLDKRESDQEPVATNLPKVAKANLVVGNEESVYTTCVDSPDNFYCQLVRTSTQLDDLMNSMEEFYRPLAADEESFSNPRVGDVCCAKFTEDDGFYRAVITKVSSNAIGVHYIDYGNFEEIPLSRVKTLNPTFTDLGAQSFNAKLFPFNPETTGDFEAVVTDKELKAKIVKKAENNVYLVQLSDSNGTKLFATGATTQQQQGTSKRGPCRVKEARIEEREKVGVYITSVTGPGDFFCQLTKTSAQLDDLMNEMEEYYRPLHQQEKAYTDVQVGEACCAMFTEDDGFYRATVKKQSGSNLDVYYMDYGNSESIPISRVKILDHKFTTLPVQGFHACVKISTGSTPSSFKDQVLEKEFDAKIVRGNANKSYEVELFKTDGEKLFGDETVKKEVKVCKVKDLQITKGSKEHVYVTFYESRESFYCQLVKYSTQLDDLMDKLEEFYRPLGDEEECLNNSQIGHTCCAMFTEDDGWYRAVVTKVSGKNLVVRYLDYGNSEELPITRVKRLLPCFAETNAQSFQASLVGATSVSPESVKAAVDGKELTVRVTDRNSNGVYMVELYEMNGNRLFGSAQDVAQAPTNRTVKDFLSAYNVTPGTQWDVCGSHCEGPTTFYLHLVQNRGVLEKIMIDLNEVYSDLQPKDNAIANPVVGMFCAAKFEADGGWYRAQILEIPLPKEVKVCYVDFGNCERVRLDDIKSLAPAFYNNPVQAMKCRLNRAKEKWNASEYESFEVLVLEQQLIARVKSIDSNTKTVTIDLIDTRGSDNLNILDVLSNKTSAKPSASQGKLPKLATLPKLQLKDVENVLVESAESLDSFVCQFSRFNHDLDTLADMMYELYHEGTPPDFVTAPLQAGDVMAAMFTEDETWYRATVSGLNQDGSVNVTFIDYGNSETILKPDVGRRVRYLTKDLIRYPAMRGVQCSLSRVDTNGQRYSWTPGAHEAFVRYVVEKEFRARISSDCEPFQAILEDKSGSIHAWLAREKLVTSRETEAEVVLDDFYELEVEVGTCCDVYVTSVENPEKFFVQQAANAEAIDKVMDDLHLSCTDASRAALINIHVGTLCAAQYTVDDAWYRARVTQETGAELFEVMFVDYGNSEVLSKERIKGLDPSLLELPAQALCCSLQMKGEISWSSEAKERFENIAADKCLNMSVVKVSDGKLLVKLKDEDGSLLNDVFDSSKNTDQGPSKSVEIILPPFPVTAKQRAEVYISHLVDPGEFYIQFSNTEAELERLAEQCSIYGSDKSEEYQVKNPRQGMFCCALYSEDNAWYRAEIIHIDSTNNTATVRFVDHGNTDVVNLGSDLRQLTADLSSSPCQAVPCTLCRGPWSNEQCSSFEASSMDKPLQATFNEYVNNIWSITFENEDDLLHKLPEQREEVVLVKKPSLSIGDKHAVYIVSVNSSDEVILQLSNHVNDLETLMDDIANNPPQTNLSIDKRKCGMYCLGRFTEDEAWYRAKVLECDAEKTKVLYVDYGNVEWIGLERLAPIFEQFAKLPEVCFQCSLDISSTSGTWTENSREKLTELYGENELQCEITSETGDRFSVKLFCDGEDVLTKVLGSEERTPAMVGREDGLEPPSTGEKETVYKAKELKISERKDVVCSHIETPQKLWCQFVEDQEILDELMNRLEEVYSVLGDEKLLLEHSVGSPCIGQFLEDDGWYRAEILDMRDEGVLVRYIDYGNEEVLPTSRLRRINAEFLSTPRQAIACLLKDIQTSDGEWNPDALALVEEFTAERSLSIKITSVDELSVTGLIYGCLEDEEVSLSDLLVEKSFTVMSKKTVEKEAQPSNNVVYTNIPAKIGDKINLFYVSSDSPSSIWCQLSDSETELLELMEKLGAFYGSLGEKDWKMEELAIGAAVCAQFTEDDSWYRAEILETIPNIVVRFIDYGNCEELPASRVKRLNPDFAVLPRQAICLSLFGVSPQSLQEFSEDKKAAMEELCSEKCYVGEVHEITDITIVGSLLDQQSNVDLLEELCRANIVRKSQSDGHVEDMSSEAVVLEKQLVEPVNDNSEPQADNAPDSERPSVRDIVDPEEPPVDNAPDSAEPPVDIAPDSAEPPVDVAADSEEQPVDSAADSQKPSVDNGQDSAETPSGDTPALEEKPPQVMSDSDELHVHDTVESPEVLDERPATITDEPLEPPTDERSLIQTENQDASENNAIENVPRTASLGDSEELNDAEAVCDAIERLLTDIDSRAGEADQSSTPEIPDLAALNIDKVQPEARNEEASAIVQNEESINDEAPVESTANEEKSDDAPNTNCTSEFDDETGDEHLERKASDSVETMSLDNVRDKLQEFVSNESPKMARVLENLSAPESDSATGSSSATPFLSPKAELTDASDEMSAYMTPPDDVVAEAAKEEPAIYSSPESDRSDNRRRYAYPEIQLGDIHKVKISYIQSPSSFFCQLMRTEIEFLHLMETIKETYTEHVEDALTIDTLTVATPCCVQSPEDDKWYRAVIRNVGNDDLVKVMLIDLGNILTVPVRRIQPISDELVTCLPRQALRCSLVDLEPADAVWSADAVAKMDEVCAGKELEGIFRSRHHKVYNIYLRDPENDASDFVNKLLVDLKLAKVTGRNSDSGEGSDPNGNDNLGQETEENNDEQKSNDDNHQFESRAMEATESVKEFLEDVLEMAVVQVGIRLNEDIEDVSTEGNNVENAPIKLINDEACNLEAAESTSLSCITTNSKTIGDEKELNGIERAEVKDNWMEMEYELKHTDLTANEGRPCDEVPSGDEFTGSCTSTSDMNDEPEMLEREMEEDIVVSNNEMLVRERNEEMPKHENGLEEGNQLTLKDQPLEKEDHEFHKEDNLDKDLQIPVLSKEENIETEEVKLEETNSNEQPSDLYVDQDEIPGVSQKQQVDAVQSDLKVENGEECMAEDMIQEFKGDDESPDTIVQNTNDFNLTEESSSVDTQIMGDENGDVEQLDSNADDNIIQNQENEYECETPCVRNEDYQLPSDKSDEVLPALPSDDGDDDDDDVPNAHTSFEEVINDQDLTKCEEETIIDDQSLAECKQESPCEQNSQDKQNEGSVVESFDDDGSIQESQCHELERASNGMEVIENKDWIGSNAEEVKASNEVHANNVEDPTGCEKPTHAGKPENNVLRFDLPVDKDEAEENVDDKTSDTCSPESHNNIQFKEAVKENDPSANTVSDEVMLSVLVSDVDLRKEGDGCDDDLDID